MAPKGGQSRDSANALAEVPVEIQITATSRPEQIGEGAVERLAERVAVIGGIDMIGARDRLHDLRADGRGIVREEAHGTRMAAPGTVVNPHMVTGC